MMAVFAFGIFFLSMTVRIAPASAAELTRMRVGILATGERSTRGLAFTLLIVGGITLPAGLSDRRMIRAGGLRGAARLRRHLWRMCLALFTVCASFVLGRRFPEPLRILPIRLIPFGVLASMVVWLWRLRRGAGAPRVIHQAG